jgi:hypothetical protein
MCEPRRCHQHLAGRLDSGADGVTALNSWRQSRALLATFGSALLVIPHTPRIADIESGGFRGETHAASLGEATVTYQPVRSRLQQRRRRRVGCRRCAVVCNE